MQRSDGIIGGKVCFWPWLKRPEEQAHVCCQPCIGVEILTEENYGHGIMISETILYVQMETHKQEQGLVKCNAVLRHRGPQSVGNVGMDRGLIPL